MQLHKIALIVLLTLTCATLKAQVKHKAKPKAKAKSSTVNISASIARGEKVYTETCSPCHQVDGGGVENLNPPLVKTIYVLGDKTRLIGIVLNGFKESIEINGTPYANNMPSHDFLKDDQIADVLTYVRNSFGNKAPAVTAAEVTKVRASVKKS